MKKNYRIFYQLVLVLIAFSSSALAQTKQASCTNDICVVAGTLQGLSDNTILEICTNGTHDEPKQMAETKLQGSKFKFILPIPEHNFVVLRVKGSYGGVNFFLEKGEITLSGSVSLQNGNNFYKVIISGSELTNLYNKKIAYKGVLDSLYSVLRADGEAISKEISEARATQNKPLLDSIYSRADYKRYAAAEKNFFEKVEMYSNESVSNNKDTWWGPFLMLQAKNYFTPAEIPQYEQFSQEAKDSYYGRKVKEELFPVSLIGKVAPDFNCTTSDGSKVKFSNLFSGKKIILLDFWASWCAPCRKEIPNLKAIYSNLASKGFDIVSVSIDKKEADWKKAMEQEKMPWHSYLDIDGKISSIYKVKLIPTMYVIDATDGNVLYDSLRGEELANKLYELLISK